MPMVSTHRSSASGEELPTRRLLPARASVVVEAISADSKYVLHLLGGRVLLAEDVVDVSEDRVRRSIATACQSTPSKIVNMTAR